MLKWVMKKADKISLFTGLSLSTLVGVWHFFIPNLFEWYSFIPEDASSLMVGIVWTNFFFSLFLSGISVLLMVFSKEIGLHNPAFFSVYAFLIFVWLCRIIITVILPMQGYDVVFVGSMTAFSLIFLLLVFPFFSALKKSLR